MDKTDDRTGEQPVGRKTRSGRTPVAVKSKPITRKTRKKMVMIEVEVSDEEGIEGKDDTIESKGECNETRDETNDCGDGVKSTEKENKDEVSEDQNFSTEILASDAELSENGTEEQRNLVNDDISVTFNCEMEIMDVQVSEENNEPEYDKIEFNENKPLITEPDVESMEVDETEASEEYEEPAVICEEINEEIAEISEEIPEVCEEPADINEEHEVITEIIEEHEGTELICEKHDETVVISEVTEEAVVDEELEEQTKFTEEIEEESGVSIVEMNEDDVASYSVSNNKETKHNLHADQDGGEKMKVNRSEQDGSEEQKTEPEKSLLQSADPDAENISEDELPGVQVAKVPETEEVSDEELPGPKRAELPADTEVVSEDELPAVKKEGTKRKIAEGDYDPGSPTSESEVSPKKSCLDPELIEKEKEKAEKPKKLPELDKYWKAVNDDPTDFTGWTYLLQYVDQENDMEAAREAYDAFLSHYPYCYGYWRKYADYEKRKGNKKKCEEVFERGLKAIPLSVDLWIHYLTYVRSTKPEDEDFIRSQFERAITACGFEFRSDRLWDSYIKWEMDGKRCQHATAIFDRLLATPTQGYTTHFDNFQEHVANNSPNKLLEVDEFLALRKEVKYILKHDSTTEPADKADVPPGEDTQEVSSDEETKAIKERIVSIRRKIHKNTATAVTNRWNFEEGIKRPYFHVKPLERCQLKNWQEYLDYEIEQGDRTRIVVLFERCLIACALYEEFWLRFVHYLEGLKDAEFYQKIKDVYERACTIHHIKKPTLHLQWAMFEESIKNFNKAAEILVNIEKSVPNLLQIAYRRINLERRREDNEKCSQLYEHYIINSKNKIISTNLAIKYSRFCLKVLKNLDKAFEILNAALTKDSNNPRLYLQLIDLTLHKEGTCEKDILGYIDSFLEKENVEVEQKILFAQRKLEFLEDFGTNIQSVQAAYDEYQKYIKMSKETKKKDSKGETGKKDKNPPLPSSQPNAYGSYGNYSNSNAGAYQYSGSQQAGQYNYQYGQGDQYQYGNWQYPQGSYSGYNQWSGYGSGYGY